MDILIKRSEPFPQWSLLLIDSDSGDVSPWADVGSLIKMHYYDDVGTMQIASLQPSFPPTHARRIPALPPPPLFFFPPHELIKLINCAKKEGEKRGDMNNEVEATKSKSRDGR